MPKRKGVKTDEVGNIDPKKARQIIKEYFAETSDHQLYDDLKEWGVLEPILYALSNKNSK